MWSCCWSLQFTRRIEEGRKHRTAQHRQVAMSFTGKPSVESHKRTVWATRIMKFFTSWKDPSILNHYRKWNISINAICMSRLLQNVPSTVHYKCYGRLAFLANKTQDDHYLDLMMMMMMMMMMIRLEMIDRLWQDSLWITLSCGDSHNFSPKEMQRNRGWRWEKHGETQCVLPFLAHFALFSAYTSVCHMETLQKDVCLLIEHF